jgi:hypothetical protein
MEAAFVETWHCERILASEHLDPANQFVFEPSKYANAKSALLRNSKLTTFNLLGCL